MKQGLQQKCMMYQMAHTVHYQSCQMRDMDTRRLYKIVWQIKGDGNDGEPDARQKLEFEKKPNIGWMVWDDI